MKNNALEEQGLSFFLQTLAIIINYKNLIIIEVSSFD